MKDEGQLLQEVLESATKKVQNWPEWRRSDEARNQLDALKKSQEANQQQASGKAGTSDRKKD